MKRMLLLGCFLFAWLYANARHPQVQYYNLVNYGEYLWYKGDNVKAYAMYRRAFALQAHKHAKDYLTAASLAFRLSDDTAALQYLELAACEPIGFNDIIIRSDSAFYHTLQSRPEWAERLQQLLYNNEQIRRQFEEEVQSPLRKTIRQWCDSDQYYTRIRAEYLKLPEDNPLRQFAVYADSMFYNRYYDYIKIHGYPGYWVSNTDELSSVNVHILPGEQATRFKQLFITELEQGRAAIHEIMWFLNLCMSTKGECALGLSPEEKCYLEDIDKIAALRLEYGMNVFLYEPRRRFNQFRGGHVFVRDPDPDLFEQMLLDESAAR